MTQLPPRRPWYRRVMPLMGMSGLLAVGGVTGWLTDQGVMRMIRPRQGAAEEWMVKISQNPAASGFALRKFTVATQDGLSLQGMVLDPLPGDPPTKRGKTIVEALKTKGLGNPSNGSGCRGTLFLLHGFNARKEHMFPFADRLCAAGFRCVVYDSRGHGDSGGRYSTFGTLEKEDLRRVIEKVRADAGPAGLGPVGLLGYSMGGATALQSQPELHEIKALAVFSTFASFQDVIARQADGRWKTLGDFFMPLVRQETRWIAGFDPWSVRPEEAATRLTCPLFLAHGSDDALIPLSHLDRIKTAAGGRLRQSMVIPGGTHGGVFVAGGDALWTEVAAFFVREMVQ